MEMTVQLYNENGAAWDAYVASRQDSTNYHRYGWRKVIENSFGHRTLYLTAKNSNNEICGVLPYVHMKSVIFGNFLVSLPFLNYGGLLCTEGSTETLLLDSSRKMLEGTGADHIELRHLKKYNDVIETKQHKVTMILELRENEEDQWKSLDAKVRNQVRKAEKNGLRAVSGSLDLLDGFYEVFSKNMRDLGTPVYDKSFFRNTLEEFPNSTEIILVKQDKRTIAAALLTWYKETLEVPWASSVRDARELCPNNLLYWEAIRFAIGKKACKFDFGRSTPGEGTYCFKKQWGAKPVQLYWQYLLREGAEMPELSPHNPKYRLAVQTWQHLPLLLTNFLGPHIVRCIP
ncbi:MAG: FemAB family PEP-CTERM system-associated protein [Desulfuromonadaceae bacterium]|nr:FemAB family PEP-CTERM system-associated protein [Desulfuromonadaceae bacterium]